MSISGNLTGQGVSSTFTPSNEVSEVFCTSNTPFGKVFLEAYEANSDSWVIISGVGVYSVSTPGIDILYRFRTEGDQADFDYYIGP